MKKPILTFYVYGMSSDGVILPTGFRESFRDISDEIKELLLREPHKTEVEIMYIPSVSINKMVTVELQALTSQQEDFLRRKDVQRIFIDKLDWTVAEEDVNFIIRKDLQLAD